MELRYKVVLLAVAPLVVGAGLLAFVIEREGTALADGQVAEAEQILLAAKQDELRHLMALALGAIRDLEGAGLEDGVLRDRVFTLLRGMSYGEDGYFWVHDLDNRILMHPRRPQLEGHVHTFLLDGTGLPFVPRLTAMARAGGGFVQYTWDRPSQGKVRQKLSYVVLLPRFGWVLGTGTYLDDVEAITHQIRASSSAAIDRTLFLLVGLAVLAALGVAVVGVALNVSQQRLADSKLRALTWQVVAAQEKERARVARELHDGVLNDLKLVKCKLETALMALEPDPSPGRPVQLLIKGVASLTDCMDEIRKISRDLHPPLPGDELPAALGQIGTAFFERTGVAATVEAPGTRPPLSNKAATALFRVAQQALDNVAQYARATQVTIRLVACRHRGSPGTCLTVTDNGQGFDAVAVEGRAGAGIGLSSMRERIAEIGGQLTIRSNSNGTDIEAFLPDSILMENEHHDNDDHEG